MGVQTKNGQQLRYRLVLALNDSEEGKSSQYEDFCLTNSIN